MTRSVLTCGEKVFDEQVGSVARRIVIEFIQQDDIRSDALNDLGDLSTLNEFRVCKQLFKASTQAGRGSVIALIERTVESGKSERVG